MSNFDYPRLRRREITGVLSGCRISSVSDADLINPTTDFISNLYIQLLIHIGYLQEDKGLVEDSDLDRLEGRELVIRTMKLCGKMREVVDALDCPWEFTLKDVIMPEAHRTELFLGAILNFCLHSDLRMNLSRPAVEELTVLGEQREELKARILQLNAEMSEFNESRESEMPFVQEAETKIKELRQAISALNNHQMSIKATTRKKEDASKEMDEKISSAEFALARSVQENAILRSIIVQSPDKLQRALEEKKTLQIEAKQKEQQCTLFMKKLTSSKYIQRNPLNLLGFLKLSFGQYFVTIVNEEAYKLAKKTRRQDHANALAYLFEASKKMNKHLLEQVNSAKQVEKEVKVLKAKNSDDGLLDKSLEAKLFEHQGRGDKLEDLLQELEKERDVKCEEASKKLHSVKLQVEHNRRGLEHRQRELEALVAEGAAMNEKMKTERDSATAKQQMLLSKCEDIIKEFFKFSNATGHLLPRTEAGACEVPFGKQMCV